MFEWQGSYFNEENVAAAYKETNHRIAIELSHTAKDGRLIYPYSSKAERDSALREFGEAWNAVLRSQS